MSSIRSLLANDLDAAPDAVPIAAVRRVIHDLLQQCRNGWDINAVQRLHTEVGRLSTECRQHGIAPIAEQLLAIESALGPALHQGRAPNTGVTALIAALTDHLHDLLPAIEPQIATPVVTPAAAINTGPRRILIACLRSDIAERLTTVLAGADGFIVRTLAEPLAVLEELPRFAPNGVIVDLHMPAYDGPELAQMIHERRGWAEVPVLYVADAGEVAADHDTLAADIEPEALLAKVRERVPAPVAEDGRDSAAPQRRGQYRRAWLLDRLDATLSGGNARGGLLDIVIDDAAELARVPGVAALTKMHAQLGDLLGNLMEPSDMLAGTEAGYLLLCRDHSDEAMRALAEEIRHVVTGERFGPAAVPMTVSVGGCMLDAGMDSADEVLAAAQGARARALPGHVAWHEASRTMLTATAIDFALQNDRLHLVFQAIVDVAGTPPAPQYQALLRLRDNDGHVHPAAELLQLAGPAGLVPALDRWALGQCLDILAGYQRQTRPLRLFVSQSCASLADAGYPAAVAHSLKACGVRGTRLVLEFRLDEVVQQPALLSRAAPYLAASGVGLCISGMDRSQAAARVLDSMPLHFVKLAPELVARPGALVPLAHARHIMVIAPQVEDEAAIHALRAAGVDFVQGNSLAHAARAMNFPFDGNAVA